MSKHYVLTPAETSFAERLVGSGRYASVDEVVQEGIRLVAEQEQAQAQEPIFSLDDLRRAWLKGANSGGYKPADEVFDRLQAKYRKMAEDRGE